MKSKKENIEYSKRAIEKIIQKRYEPEGEEGGSLIATIILLISSALIILGGLFQNGWSLASGSILLIFLYFALK